MNENKKKRPPKKIEKRVHFSIWYLLFGFLIMYVIESMLLKVRVEKIPYSEFKQLLRDGHTAIGGRIPTCPSGGVSSFGEAVAAQGLLQVYELILQLRGLAGPRQISNAKVGLAQTYGLAGNSATAILKV